MTVKNCLNKLVTAGRITREAADQALGLHERLQGKFDRHMGPTTNEAAAALEAARLMEETALEKKASLAQQAIRAQAAEERARGHDRGLAAGVMGQLTRDIWERGGLNVWTHTEVVLSEMTKRFHAGLEAYRSRLAGLKQDIAGAHNMVRELFGSDTGDEIAKAAAKGWNDAVDYGTARVRSAGKVFDALEDWRLPQFWSPSRIRDTASGQILGTSRKAEFLRDLKTEIEAGTVNILDKETGRWTAAERLDARLEEAYRDMLDGGGAGGAAFSRQARTIHFVQGEAGAEAWLRLQGKYGGGQDVMSLMRGHMQHMAREAALIEILGPQHGATVRMLREIVRQGEKDAPPLSRYSPVRWFESESAIGKTYDVLTGRVNEVVSDHIAGVMGGLRSLTTSSVLGGGIISAVPGDTVTTMLAAQHVGMPGMNVVARAVRDMTADQPALRENAARLNIVSHAMMDHAVGTRAFEDSLLDQSTLAKVATFVIRAQGMTAWTEGMKRAFTMEFMGFLSASAARRFDDLDAPLRAFLSRHQMHAAEWDRLRATAPTEVVGAKFFDLSAVEDRALTDRLHGAIIEERGFAVLEPDARVQALTSGGLQRGTFWGEMVRSVYQFKSFSMTMATTHLMRIATQGPLESRAWRGVNFLLLHFAAGAAAIQAKQMLAGKDPRDMADAKFWGAALLQGGGLGIYGDLINAANSRTGHSPLADFGGPVLGLGEDALKLMSGNIRKYYEGEDTTVGAQALKIVKRNAPGSTLWYSRLATDRLIWDQLQTMVDADYRQSFRRMEKKAKDDYGQRFWWRPGETSAQRGPDLRSAWQR